MFPPIYPFVFGLLVKLFGFGWQQCVFYDALIRAMLAYLGVCLARKMAGDRISEWTCWLVALAILPLEARARPDELAVCFGLGGLLLLMNPGMQLVQVIASGILLGLCAGTSMGAAGMLSMMAVVLLLTAPINLLRKFQLLLVLGGFAVGTLCMVTLPILARYPGALDQFRANSALFMNWSRKDSFLPYLLWNVRNYRTILASILGLLFLCLVLGVGRQSATKDFRCWYRYLLCTLASLGFWTATVAGKILYLSYLYPWLIALAVAELAWHGKALAFPKRLFAVLFLFISVILGSEGLIKSTLSMATLVSDQRQNSNEELLNKIIPPGSRVLATDAWWLLAKDHLVYDARFTHPDMSEVDFVVLGGNGSGAPGQPVIPTSHSEWLASFPLFETFHVVHDNLNRYRPKLFGFPLTRSSYGFGTMVLERNSRTQVSRSPSASPRFLD